MKGTALLVSIVILGGSARAATLDVEVRDAKGAALEDTAVWAMPRVAPPASPKREASIEQIKRQFVPLVTVIQTGTQVLFPNRDEIRHHVYSFSTPKTFEIKLYAASAAPRELFDKPGEVVLGCNIHDQMIAYVYVVDTPWFAKSGRDGRARLEGLPAGDYEIHVRHYGQSAALPARPLKLRADEAANAQFAIATKALLTAPGAATK